MKKVLNYDTLGWALKAMSDACFKAAEQQKKGGEGYGLWNER